MKAGSTERGTPNAVLTCTSLQMMGGSRSTQQEESNLQPEGTAPSAASPFRPTCLHKGAFKMETLNPNQPNRIKDQPPGGDCNQILLVTSRKRLQRRQSGSASSQISAWEQRVRSGRIRVLFPRKTRPEGNLMNKGEAGLDVSPLMTMFLS